MCRFLPWLHVALALGAMHSLVPNPFLLLYVVIEWIGSNSCLDRVTSTLFSSLRPPSILGWMEGQVTASSLGTWTLAIFIHMKFFSVGTSFLGPMGLSILGLLIPLFILMGLPILLLSTVLILFMGLPVLSLTGLLIFVGLPVSSLTGLLIFMGLPVLSLTGLLILMSLPVSSLRGLLIFTGFPVPCLTWSFLTLMTVSTAALVVLLFLCLVALLLTMTLPGLDLSVALLTTV